MNLEELRKIIDEYKDKIIINHPQPGQLVNNKLLLQKYKYIFSTIKEMVYLVKNYDNLENLHIFCYCGNKNNFGSIKSGYHKYCSVKCMNNNIIHNNKIKQKMLSNIDENGLNNYQRAYKQAHQNYIKKYNISSPWKNQNVINKIRKNKLNNIDKNGLNCYQRATQKMILTKKNTIDENGLNIFQKQAIKCKNTRINNIDENGLNSYKQAVIKQVKTKRKIIDENGLNLYQQSTIKGMKKRYNTMKKNHTFNTSKSEEQVYNYLLQKFSKNDIERQYKSKLYPFNCDFYIKSLDLYIECHFHWTHSPTKNNHRKPFKNSVEDMKIIDELKKKSQEINFKGERKLQYLNMINIWSKSDPLKLQTFKKNKLNYKIFYNIDQFENWYNKINKDAINNANKVICVKQKDGKSYVE